MEETHHGEITHLLSRWTQGDPDAMEKLAPLVYDQLRVIAETYLRNERPEHTLQPTAFTPQYASPEQVTGETMTFASDVYSAGVLFYRLMTGRLPYEVDTASPATVEEAVCHAQPELSGLDAALDAVISKALSKDPAGRYTSCAEMDADLVRYLENQPVHARLGRARRVPWALSVLTLVAVCAAVWLVHTGRISIPPNGALSRQPNPEAQDLYLKGRYYWNKRTPESLSQAVDYFTQAIGKDPGNASAYVGLA